MKKVVVSIDGPAAAGKSTIAKEVARRLNYTYIDTGAMYRCVALQMIRDGIGLDADIEKIKEILNKVKITFKNMEDKTIFVEVEYDDHCNSDLEHDLMPNVDCTIQRISHH